MKKISFILMAVIFLLALAGCGNKGEPEFPAIRGTVTEISLNNNATVIMVEGKVEEDTQHDKARVTIDQKTKMYMGDQKASVDDLKENMVVEVYTNGPVAESYPVQMGADKVVILNNGETVEETPQIRGEITEIDKNEEAVVLTVEGEKEEDTEYDKAKVTLQENTKVYKDEQEMHPDELSEGMTVEVYYKGVVDTSYPVQMGADKILILE